MAFNDAFSRSVRPVLNALDDVSRLIGHGTDSGIAVRRPI